MGPQLKLISRIGLLSAAAAIMSHEALAQDKMSGGDTAWIITATALVLFMTLPGLSKRPATTAQSRNGDDRCRYAVSWLVWL